MESGSCESGNSLVCMSGGTSVLRGVAVFWCKHVSSAYFLVFRVQKNWQIPSKGVLNIKCE